MLKVLAIHSPDLEPPTLPEDPHNCRVAIGLSIGKVSSTGGDIFQFEVVTPAWLADNSSPRWGRGLLIVPVFSWETVQQAIARLLAGVSAESWEQAALELSRPLSWEFENYRSHIEDVR